MKIYKRLICNISKRRVITSVLLAFLLFVNFAVHDPGTTYTCSINAGGLNRTSLIHIPHSFDISKPRPLIIALHGGGGKGKNMVKLTCGGFDKLSDEEGFVVVYPDGIDKHWNDGRGEEETGYRVHKDNIDDTGFISTLIDHLINKMNIDPKRVYVTGMSNGAIMSYRLACQLSEKIAAIAPVAGNIPENILHSCSPSSPVSVLAINNTDDPLVPFNGGYITGPFGKKKLGKVLSAYNSVKFWANYDNCSKSPLITYEPDRDPDDGMRIRTEVFGNGKNETEVILYAIEGGGHTWPGGYQYLGKRIIGNTSRDINACEVIWDFFKKHSKQMH
jgi:polyhydroxybutyrate depolymerase